MEPKAIILPQYVKLSLTLLSLAIITLILYLGQNILVPILLALLFSILLNPVVNFLNRKLRFHRVLAIIVSVTLFVLLISAVLFFISWQVSDITQDWKKIKQNLGIHYERAQHWIKAHLHMSYKKQQVYLDQVTESSLNGKSELMGNTLSSFTDVLLNVILIPVYTFLVLLYKNLFIGFFHRVVRHKNEGVLQQIFVQVKTVVQGYITGLIIEMGIVGVLTAAGLMIMGVPYAVLLAVITAILNLVPYLGILIAAVITMLATLAHSSNLSTMIGIIVLTIIVQFIDNNIIVPKIVGNKVRINALASMVGVIVGATVGGIPGMILSIPLIAIIKVIFDHVEPLKAWGFLLGNSSPAVPKLASLK